MASPVEAPLQSTVEVLDSGTTEVLDSGTTEVLDGGQVPVASSSAEEPPSDSSSYDVNLSRLSQYEEMFGTRFSMKSESFAAIADNGFSKTVSVYPWTSRPKRNYDFSRRNGNGGQYRGGRGGGNYRRDWRRDDRSRDQPRSRDDDRDRRQDRDGDDRRRYDRVQYPGRR
uniref:Btz domain-containing protein n=1 Tax=Steinernema glaseri TaxID=37863 RepID=A0A1I7YSH3_9BILA